MFDASAWSSGLTETTIRKQNGVSLVANGGGGLTLAAADANGTFRLFTGGENATNQRMTILSNGNVGIGTTSPSRKLHVAGTILIDGDENGIAGTIGLTNVNDATLSSGNGTVKLKGTTARDSAGFIKMYVGTTTVWVPYWTNIS